MKPPTLGHDLSSMRRPILSRALSEPMLERPRKAICIRKAKEEGNIGQRKVRLINITLREIPTRPFKQTAE